MSSSSRTTRRPWNLVVYRFRIAPHPTSYDASARPSSSTIRRAHKPRGRSHGLTKRPLRHTTSTNTYNQLLRSSACATCVAVPLFTRLRPGQTANAFTPDPIIYIIPNCDFHNLIFSVSILMASLYSEFIIFPNSVLTSCLSITGSATLSFMPRAL